MDLFEKVVGKMGPLGIHAKEAHHYFTFPKLEGEIAPRMNFRGKEVLTWSLNNYLGLANHPEVRKADAEAAQPPRVAAQRPRIQKGSAQYREPGLRKITGDKTENSDRRQADYEAYDPGYCVRGICQQAPCGLGGMMQENAQQYAPDQNTDKIAGQYRVDRIVDQLLQ